MLVIDIQENLPTRRKVVGWTMLLNLNSDVQEFQANTSNNEGKPLFKYEFDVTESL